MLTIKALRSIATSAAKLLAEGCNLTEARPTAGLSLRGAALRLSRDGYDKSATIAILLLRAAEDIQEAAEEADDIIAREVACGYASDNTAYGTHDGWSGARCA